MSVPAKILVIEDASADVFLLRYGLDQCNEEYELAVLQSGDEALRYVRNYHPETGEPTPCVIVLDLHLPGYDGLEILRAIRRDPDLGHVAVAVVSTFASPTEKDEVEAFHAHYLPKPRDLKEAVEWSAAILAICKRLVTV